MSMSPRRTPPKKVSPVIQAIQAEAERQNRKALSLAKETGLSLFTVQRLLNGEGSPSLATLETVMDALGLTLEVRRKK